MTPSFRIGRLFGIGVYVHWTFLLLLVVIGAAEFVSGGDVPLATKAAAAGERVLFLLVLFGCVVLHEFGHVLAGRAYGIRTRDVILLPIGGVARMEGSKWSATSELVIAVAGPAVNVAIAAVLVPLIAVKSLAERAAAVDVVGSGFLTKLALANVALVVFNMLPAFPMDGGRVLRAVLGYMMPFERATVIAVRCGQVLAAGVGVAAIVFFQPMLLLVALFVFGAASAELAMMRAKQRAEAEAVRRRGAWGVGAPAAQTVVTGAPAETSTWSTTDIEIARNWQVLPPDESGEGARPKA
jgi:stage IV sporulation protein FB